MLLNVLLLSPAVLIYVVPLASNRQKKQSKPKQANETSSTSSGLQGLDPLPVRPFITTYRGTMMVVTCLAILAVDFRVFPRRFAKVENWGTSLMDVGVGSFVFSAGTVSARPILRDQLAGNAPTLSQRLYSSIRHSLPLLVLGMVRLYSVKGLDYAEHTTEYGVHWNFFFTLAMLPPFATVFQFSHSSVFLHSLLSSALGGIYQSLLEFTDLKAYILTAPRVDILSQNREGIFSFLGYLAIFLAGQATGFYILPRHPNRSSSTANVTAQRKRLIFRLASWSIIWGLLFYLTTSYRHGLGLRVSRRLANLPYIFWVSTFNCTQLTLFCIIETVSFPGVHKVLEKTSEAKVVAKATSKVLKAFNRNGLAIFLLANLMTGLINLNVKTLEVSRERAIAVLVGYAGILTTVAIILNARNISVKV